VVRDVVDEHGSERARPDVERERREAEAPRAGAREELGREVEPRRGRGDGARRRGEDRLVLDAVALVGVALHVGRQRDGPDALGEREHGLVALEAHGTLAAVVLGDDLARGAAGERDADAGPQAPRRLDQRATCAGPPRTRNTSTAPPVPTRCAAQA
jgi:hypothetical protein